jgi:hypothetical protein
MRKKHRILVGNSGGKVLLEIYGIYAIYGRMTLKWVAQLVEAL